MSSGYLFAQELSDTVSSHTQTRPPFAGSPRYNKVLTDAMILQNKVDSLEEQEYNYRQEIMYMDNISDRNRLQFQIGILGEEMKSIQYEADSLFNILSEMTEFEEEHNTLLILDTVIEGIKVYTYNPEEFNSNGNRKNVPGSSPASSNDFSILKEPAYSSGHPFENNFKIPAGVFYRVQLAAISQEADWDQFGGIQPVTVEPNDDGRLMKYFAGKFSNYSEADSALNRIRTAGFRDAFIVGYYNGKRMSTEQVREFEKSER